MLYHVSIHRPKPEHEQDVIDSMHRFGAAARLQDGLLDVGHDDLHAFLGKPCRQGQADAAGGSGDGGGRSVNGSHSKYSER